MKIYVSSPLMANDTVYGFEARYLDFARMLMSEGITPHELKEHYHDFEWVANIINEQIDNIVIRATVKRLKLSDIVSDPLSPEAKDVLLKTAELSCLEQEKLMKGYEE